jgi:hypothetical protein
MAKIKRWEVEYVYTHMWVAHILFRSSLHHQVAQVAFQTEVAPVMLQVHPCICASNVSEFFCGAILARKTAVLLIFVKHCRASFDRSLHLVMPGELNILLLQFSDFRAWRLDWL